MSILFSIMMNSLMIIMMLLTIIFVLRIFGEKLQQELLISSGKIWMLMPGTVVHELSHLLVALLFGLHINKVSLFKFNQETGELGSVNYSYNQYSMKDRIGVTLSSVAPIFGISLIEYFIYVSLFKNHIKVIMDDIMNNQMFQFIKDFFMTGNLPRMILFIVISLILLSGLSISGEDIQAMKIGMGSLIGIIILICSLSMIFSFVRMTVFLYLKLLLFFTIPMMILSLISIMLLKIF